MNPLERTPMTLIENLVQHLEAAAQLPLVHSGPLIELGRFLSQEGETIEQLDTEETEDLVMELLEAAETLSQAWSFWPEGEYGSTTALIDTEAVQDAIHTIQRCKRYLAGDLASC